METSQRQSTPSNIKQTVNDAISEGFKELFLSPNLMREAISWLSPARPHTDRLKLFSKQKTLLLTIEPYDEITSWDAYQSTIYAGRESLDENFDYLWVIDDMQSSATSPQCHPKVYINNEVSDDKIGQWFIKYTG